MFLCSLFNNAINNSGYTVSNGWTTVRTNRKSYQRKWVWHHWRYYPITCLEGLRKWKTSVREVVSQMRLCVCTSQIKSKVLPLQPTCLYFSLLTQNPEILYDKRLAALDKVGWIPEEIKIVIHVGKASYHSPEDLCLYIYLKTSRINIQNHNSMCFYTGTKLPHILREESDWWCLRKGYWDEYFSLRGSKETRTNKLQNWKLHSLYCLPNTVLVGW